MINRVKVLKGFASELPSIKDRVFQFNEGLNVLFGSNGCGKSTLLRCIKAYNGIKHAGWSKISDDGELPASSNKHFPYAYRAFTPTGECDTIVEWDGSASFYNDSELRIDDMAWYYNKDILKREGLTTEAEQFDILTKKPSAGQTRILKLNKIFTIAKDPPLFKDYLPTGSKYERMEQAFLKSIQGINRVTIMLDEPEKSLSIPKQIELFQHLKSFQKDFQIIIATHSPFILFEDDLNIVEMEDGYIKTCKDIIKSCADKIESLDKN